MNEQVCTGSAGRGSLMSFLPDLTQSDVWVFDGEVILDGVATNRWANHTKVFNYTNHYYFFSDTATGNPVMIVMHGYDYLWGS